MTMKSYKVRFTVKNDTDTYYIYIKAENASKAKQMAKQNLLELWNGVTPVWNSSFEVDKILSARVHP